MKQTLKKLRALLPGVEFKAGDTFYWSPDTRTVTYNPTQTDDVGQWALLHEVGHAALEHKNYASDVELLLLEVAAWDHAQKLAKELGKAIDPEHVQDCLDTYRDWLHQRATCPMCGVVSLQTTPRQYQCFNCAHHWQVSSSRFCRPYRLSTSLANEKSPKLTQATFQ